MNLQVAGHAPHARIARKLAASAALVVLATGVLVLLGWLLDIPSLKSVLPGFVTMKANTAAGFILAGASLALLGRAARSVRIRRLSQACAGATALLGLLTLIQYLFALNFGIDQVLFLEPAGAIKTLSPGRMAPSTALNFLLLGSALLLAGFRRGIRIAQPLALLAGWIGLKALIGYLYGASALYGIGVYTQMAMHTAVAFAILGFGVLLARPAEGFMRTVTSNTMGGLLIRRIMPFVVVLPVVLGWLRVQGEEHGYFDSAFGVALMMIVIMLTAMGVTWWTAGTLNRSDKALSFKTMLLEAQSETSPDGILAVDGGGKSIFFNKRFGELWKIPQHILDTGDDGKMLECILGQLKDPAGFGRKVAYLYEHQDEKSRDEIEFVDGRCFDRYSSPLVGADGKYYGRIWYFRDITDRKRMERELRRLAVIAQQAPQGISVADLDGNLQFVNGAWARMHGYESGAELVGKHLSVFHTDEQMKADVAPFIETARRQGHNWAEVGHVRKDGTTFPTQMSVVVLKDEQGEPYGLAGFAEDITERKQAEEEIVRERENLKAIFEASPVGLLLMDDSTVVTAVNDVTARLAGKASAEMINRQAGEALGCVHASDDVRGCGHGPCCPTCPVRAAIEGVLKTGQSLRAFEVQPVLVVGGAKVSPWLEISAEPLMIDGRRHVIASVVNITERKKAEEERRRLAAILEATPGLVGFADAKDAHLLYVNKAGRLMTGLAPDEDVTRLKISDVHPDWANRMLVETVLPTASRDGVWTGECAFLHRDGHEIPVLMVLHAHKNSSGEVEVFSIISHDITDRKRAEEALHLFKDLVEHSSDAIGMSTPDGRHYYQNETFDLLFGDTGDCPPATVFVDQAIGKLVFDTIMSGGSWQGEVKMFKKDRTILDIFLRASAIQNQDGRIIGLVGLHTDITQRKRAEEAVRQAKVEAEQANAAKSEFLANMSHEIRTPMTAILGFTEMIGSSIECCHTCPEHQACPIRAQNKESVHIIRRNGEHLLELINDILDISKIEAGKFVMDVQACSLPSLIADVISMMRVRAEQHGILLSVDYETEIPETVHTDGVRVRQALVNLIDNAVKFTERGGVRMAASFLSAWRDGQPAVRVRVIDTGIGISEEKLAQLFQPFVQADASTSRKYGGTGLGLVISRHLAELLGGELTVESTVGKGSTFTLTIPTGSLEGVRMLKNPAEAMHGEAASLHPPAAGEKFLAGTRILVAEDGPDNQRLICTMLSTAGAQVELAADGREAVAKAQAASFDVVLMDMQMPVMDGYEATRTLRAQGYAVPILALTAHAMTGDRQKCLAAGCTDHLTKPIDRRRLIEAVARYAGKAVSGEGRAAPTPESSAGDPEVIRSQYAADPDLAEVLGQFVAGLPRQIEAMRLAAQAGRREELRRLAHRLKGAGGSYGYPSLTETARELEVAARAGDVEAAGIALGRLTAMSRAIVRGMVPESVSKEVKS